jgi:hypothetical protein
MTISSRNTNTALNWIVVTTITLSVTACVARTSPTPIDPVRNRGWKTFSDSAYGLTVRYPPNADAWIVTLDQPTSDRFINIVDVAPGASKPSFVVEILSYPRIEFYHPPAGVDVEQWVIHNTVDPHHYDDILPMTAIANLPALHVRQRDTTSRSFNDTYFVIKERRLYEIKILDPTDDNTPEEQQILDSIALQ